MGEEDREGEVSDYNSEYNDAVAPRKSDTELLLNSLDHQDRRGYEHGIHPDPHQTPDMTKRGVIADKLQEEGRDHEADLLRSPHPVSVKGGVVKPDYWHHQEGYPIYYTLPHKVKRLDGWGQQRVDNDPICSDCANQVTGDDPHGTPVLEQHPHWEGPPIDCVRCGADIESAYGDPHAEE